MPSSWPIWLIGVLVLALAGFATTFVARRRARDLRVRTAWSSARASIQRATISRNGLPGGELPAGNVEAEDLLSEASLLTAARGGLDAAHTAGELADRADALWRSRE